MRVTGNWLVGYWISRIKAKADNFVVVAFAGRGHVGLVPSHGEILHALARYEPLSMQEIARFVDKDKSTVTVLVDKLARSGYVQRRREATDGRVITITLSETGRAAAVDAAEVARALAARLHQGFTRKERELFRALLDRALANF